MEVLSSLPGPNRPDHQFCIRSKYKVHNRCSIQCQHLTHNQPADDGDSERPAHFGTRPCSESQRQGAEHSSYNATVDSYRALLAGIDAGHLDLPDENFDLGAPPLAGQYKGADVTYEKLLGKLSDRKFVGIPADLRRIILDHYKDQKPPACPCAAKVSAAWAKLLQQREQLEEQQPESANAQ